jgi:hypothetical protein
MLNPRPAIERAPWWTAALVGVAQGVAIIPGISRSGSTIVAGLAAGLRREDAVRFSFLLSLPAICGGALLELRHPPAGRRRCHRAGGGDSRWPLRRGTSRSFVLRWTREGKLWQFGSTAGPPRQSPPRRWPG